MISVNKIPKCTGMVGARPIGGSFSARLFYENHFKEEKTTITPWDGRALKGCYSLCAFEYHVEPSRIAFYFVYSVDKFEQSSIGQEVSL